VCFCTLQKLARRNDTRRLAVKLGNDGVPRGTRAAFMFHVEPSSGAAGVCENPRPPQRPMSFFARYAALLAARDLRTALIASLVGRLPVGIAGLAILLLVQSVNGSFASAGAATASYVAGLAALAPTMGRLIDRRGPRRVLLACAVFYPVSLATLVASIASAAPAWWYLTLAATAGATFPPITVCMRTYFKQRLGDSPLLATAYSLESVLIESIFILGPMLVALFVALASPSVAVLFAAVCASGGTMLFLRSPALKYWKLEPLRASEMFGPLSAPRFLVLLAVVLCYSIAFGLVEIGVTGFATAAGTPALAGVLLGLMSVGSVVGGLVYGSRGWHMPVARQFSLALLLMAFGILPLACVTSIWMFASLSALSGIVMAPALAMQSMLVVRTAPSDSSAEAFTWSATSLLAGVGIGFALGGVILESTGSATVIVAAAAASLAGAVSAYTCLSRES
jgi:Major Facilitator Superfamily